MIAFDAAAGAKSASGASSAGANITIAGLNRILFAAVADFNNAGDTITDVACGGVPLTKIGSTKGFNSLGSPTDWLSLWYLIAPPLGTNLLQANRSGSGSVIIISGASYTGAMQSGIPDASVVGGNDTSTTPSVSLTPTRSGCWLILACAAQDTISAGTNATIRSNQSSGGGAVIADNNAAIIPAASTTIGLTLGAAAPSGLIAVSFAPVPPFSGNSSPMQQHLQIVGGLA